MKSSLVALGLTLAVTIIGHDTANAQASSDGVRRGGWAGQVRRANVRCRKKIAGVPLRSGAAETSSSSGHILKCPATQPTGRVSLKYRSP